jgi:hypothetical protein
MSGIVETGLANLETREALKKLIPETDASAP